MNKILNKINPWFLPIMILLFILEIFTFPFVVNVTYSDRSENPDYFLTYTTNKLRWDYNVNIKSNGVAELSLFDIVYGNNAESYNGDKIIAPGLENKNIIRLKNSSDKKIQYTAVLYKYDTTENLPIKVDFKNKEDFSISREYYLPNELEHVQVLRTVTGSLKSNRIQDFDIGWEWKFHISDNQDRKDTILGNKEILDKTTVGFYIVVKEGTSEPDDGGSSSGGGIVIRPPKDEEPDTPDVPDKPEDPDTPIEPDIPEIPVEPDKPTEPQEPDKPGTETPGDIDSGETGDTDLKDTNTPEDGEQIIKPEVPKTGDERLFEMYITLMIISGIVLIIMLIERRMEKKKK